MFPNLDRYFGKYEFLGLKLKQLEIESNKPVPSNLEEFIFGE